MSTPAAPGLRDRRRRETALEICTAALDLFEEKGVAGTTVDEIAARAGVSPRTFFRLAGSHNDRPLMNLAYASTFLADAGIPLGKKGLALTPIPRFDGAALGLNYRF